MPFLHGSLSVRRYAVMSDVPESLERTATLAVRRYAWRPIDNERGEKESFGWVNPRAVLQNPFSFDDIIVRPYIFLGVRKDRKSFSPVLFRARRDAKFDKIKDERGITRLSRQQRIALEEELTIEMLKETSASSAFNELVWDLNANFVLMGASSNALCERIQELFEATFDLKLRPMAPALQGAERIEVEGLEENFARTGG